MLKNFEGTSGVLIINDEQRQRHDVNMHAMSEQSRGLGHKQD